VNPSIPVIFKILEDAAANRISDEFDACERLNGSTCPSSSSSSATTAPSILPKANNVSVSNSSIVNTISAQTISFATWHSRLGHPSSDVQRIVLNLRNIPFNNKTRLDFGPLAVLVKLIDYLLLRLKLLIVLH